MKIILIFLFSACYAQGFSQNIKILTSGTKTSIRGLSVVDDRVIWASGSNGTVGLSVDSGKTWKWKQVLGFEKTDFRDIEAFDGATALIMGIASPGLILRTVDGGESWKVVYDNPEPKMFLDAMEFWNEQSGIAIGDPINGKFFITRTFDGGHTWRDIPPGNYPVADSGEACFASSGTNIRALAKDQACFVSGGLRSRLFIKDKRIDLPLLQGKETTGANSVAVKNKKTLIVVGGDFTTPDSTSRNCCITKNGGRTWELPTVPPHGYRSCVEFLAKKTWICCGINGVDLSTDEGHTWHWISKEGFNTCRKAKNGSGVFFAGSKGKIGKIIK